MGTDLGVPMTIERYRRSTRRYHAAVYATTLLLLATGWWLAGREGTPSPLALVTGVPDVELHVWFGWALLLVAVLPLPFALRGVATFVRETIRVDPGDRAWLVRWPIAIATGRFPRHEGHFDPGQSRARTAICRIQGSSTRAPFRLSRLTPDQQRATALARSTEQLVDLAELARAPDEGAGSHYVIFLPRPTLASRLRLVEAVR